MSRRGRPRHPDILTPREWEVLALLRAELTNEQIAERLEITERTAKYHVSEILGKLGVSSRSEAAAWRPEQHQPWWLAASAPFAFLWRKASVSWLSAALSGGLVVVTLGGLGLIAFLLLRDVGEKAILIVPVTPGAQERLLFSAGGSIYTVAPDGSELREVVPGDRESQWNAAPALSPDGSRLLFTRDYEIWAVDADGRDARLLAEVAQLSTPPGGGASNLSVGAQGVAWSPDGTRILYHTARIGGSGIDDVWVMRADGTERSHLLLTGSFVLPAWLDSERVAVYESGRIRVFLPRGAEEPDIPIPNEERGSLTATIGTDGTWLIGPFNHEGPILYGPPQDLQQVATGVSPKLSPDGRRFAYFQDDTLRVASVDGEDDREVLDLTPLGGRDRFFAEQPECFPQDLAACSYRTPIISWWAKTNLYRSEEFGIEFRYAGSWAEGTAEMPYASCFGCTVFGPPEASPPYGVYVFEPPADLSGPDCGGEFGGCPVTAFFGIRALPDGPQEAITVGLHEALQQRMLRQPPLVLTNETGETRLYREITTAIETDGGGLLIIGFYREDDADAEREVTAAYDALLKSVRLD